LKEAAIMCQFNHPNIVSLIGVCTSPLTEPTMIILEYMHLGALHGYLQSSIVKDQLESLSMMRFALDVGLAMQYLAEAGFVHRDLAARYFFESNFDSPLSSFCDTVFLMHSHSTRAF
jgi:serine/threonine protein kinase